MLTAYIISAVVGLGLILMTALTGDHGDHGSESDFHGADHDHSHDGGDIWLPFLSLRFWTYFAAVFGSVGFLLTVFQLAGPTPTAWYAICSGLAVGLFVSFILRLLKKGEITSGSMTRDLLGSEAKMLVAASADQNGKARMNIKGDLIDMIARPDRNVRLEIGESVIVIGVEGDHVIVGRREDILG